MISACIISIGLAQSLFAAFVLATKKERAISDWILVACLLTITLRFSIILAHQAYPDYFDLQFSLGMIPLSFGAYLYLYTGYLTSARTKFDNRDLLHAVPILTLIILYFAFFKDKVDFNEVSYFVNDDYLWVRTVFGLIVFTSIVVYTVLTFVKLRTFRKTLTERFSYENNQLRLLWLNFIFILFVFLFATYFITGGVNAFSYEKVIETEILSHIGLTIIAFTVSYFGLRQKAFDENAYVRIVKTPTTGESVQKQNAGQLDEEDADAHLLKLDQYMLKKKPFLDPELTLHDLASSININDGTLTHLLNHHLGENFFTYVNEFRLEAVIEIFEDPEYNHFKIMAVARDCGFNSKSTFNSLFKKRTGKTPSEYKKASNLRHSSI